MCPLVPVQIPAKAGACHCTWFRTDRKKRNNTVFRCIHHHRLLDHSDLFPVRKPPFRIPIAFKKCKKRKQMIYSTAAASQDGNLSNRSFPEEIEGNFRVSPVFCRVIAFNRRVWISAEERMIAQRIHIPDYRIRYDSRCCSRRQSRICCDHHHSRSTIDNNRTLRRSPTGDHDSTLLLHLRDSTLFFYSSRTSPVPMEKERTRMSSKFHQGG